MRVLEVERCVGRQCVCPAGHSDCGAAGCCALGQMCVGEKCVAAQPDYHRLHQGDPAKGIVQRCDKEMTNFLRSGVVRRDFSDGKRQRL
jgi:hypothetical protein